MNHTLLISALLATLSLAACDNPTLVNVPATPVAVPGPAGPQGETGSQHDAGQIDLERPVMRRHVPLPVLLAPRLAVHASRRCDGRTSRTGM